MSFLTTTLPTIINLAIPMAGALGVDLGRIVGDKSEDGAKLKAVGKELMELGAAIESAFEDERLSGEEINNIIQQARDVPEALKQLGVELVDQDPEE